jgi:hypothetical protein
MAGLIIVRSNGPVNFPPGAVQARRRGRPSRGKNPFDIPDFTAVR